MQTFFGRGWVAFVASAFGHLALLWWMAEAVGTLPWEKAAGKAGQPGTATEVTVWMPGEVRSAKVSTRQRAKRAAEAEVIADSPEPSPASQGEGASSGMKAGNSGSFGAGGTSLSYRALLHSFLDQSKSYPSSLRELGLQGLVRVTFRVTREGKLSEIVIPEQEAPGPLRAEALKFLKRLRAVPVPPGNLSDAELHFELPLRYEGRNGAG